MKVAHESYPITFDFFGKSAELRIISEKEKTLFVIDKEDAYRNGESEFQILEGNTYEYILTDPDLVITPVNGIVSQSKAEKHRGRIVPNIFVGTLSLFVAHFSNPHDTIKISIEVLATKFDTEPDKGYRKNYRQMLEDITSKSTDLLLQSGTPVSQNFEINFDIDNRTLYQRFCFVRSVIDSKEFNEAVSRIIASPKTTWREEELEQDIRKVKRFTSKLIRQIASRGDRIRLPENHALNGFNINAVPRKLSTYQKTDSVDNSENRFIKHVLAQYLIFAQHCSEVFAKESRERKEALAMMNVLESHLHHEFFKEISRPSTIAINNPVLQRRSGYREILKSWLMFDLAAKLIWSGGEDVYEGGKRDIATLYEYWLFFTLYDLFGKKFGLTDLEHEDEKINNLFKLDKHGINLILKSGNHIALSGKHDFGSRKLNIKFSYNRSFKGGKQFSVNKGSGSWSTTLRPDYTISFWPAELNESEAERNEEIVHIHFDAKYKVVQFEVNQKLDRELLDQEEENERKGIYKNPDLLKMHAYKDAIRRTGGAYVLYPGTENKEFNGFHELIPGLGAFAINPSNEMIGINNISSFIDRVIENLLDRSSQRERMASQTQRIHDKPKHDKLLEPFPEYINGQKLIPDEATIVIGYYKSQAHLDWILLNNLYNFRTGTRVGSLHLTPDNIGAKYLILHGKNDMPTGKIFELKNTGPRIYSKKDIQLLNYPDAKGELYVVYEITKDVSNEFGNVRWDLLQLKNFGSSRNSQKPITSTLSQLMKTIRH